MKPIKVITIRQPWAGLIMLKLKNLENRTWTTGYRGRLVIQASAQMHDVEWMAARYTCQKIGVKFPDGETLLGRTGELLGVVDLTDILPPPSIHDMHVNPWRVEANYGWVLENPVGFPITIPVKGKLGLWDLPDMPLPESVRRILYP